MHPHAVTTPIGGASEHSALQIVRVRRRELDVAEGAGTQARSAAEAHDAVDLGSLGGAAAHGGAVLHSIDEHAAAAANPRAQARAADAGGMLHEAIIALALDL